MKRLDAVRLMAVARKEARQLRRDRRSLALAFLLPVLLLLFFGYAIRFDVDRLALAVVDHDAGSASRALIDAFEASGYFYVVARLDRADDADPLLARGDARAVLVIPPGFARDLGAARPAPVQLLLDGGDANTATLALNYADAIVMRHNRERLPPGGLPALPIEAETRVWYNPSLESRNMIVPGLIAVIMSIVASMLTALTIAREWERGTMEQLAATPVTRLEVLLGKMIPYMVIGFVDVVVATIAGVVVFGVPLRGDLVLLGALTLLFLIGALGVGLFMSATLRSQVLAMQASIIATFLPALLLSGFLFDIGAMPAALRAVTYVVPARYYIAVTRGVFLKGVGLEVLWVQALSMIVFAAVGLGLATAAFQKRLA